MAEFHAIVLGQTMVVEIGVHRIVIESDSKYAMELISSHNLCLNEFGTFLQNVNALVSQH